jgi:hypothetical protein
VYFDDDNLSTYAPHTDVRFQLIEELTVLDDIPSPFFEVNLFPRVKTFRVDISSQDKCFHVLQFVLPCFRELYELQVHLRCLKYDCNEPKLLKQLLSILNSTDLQILLVIPLGNCAERFQQGWFPTVQNGSKSKLLNLAVVIETESIMLERIPAYEFLNVVFGADFQRSECRPGGF